MAQFIETIRAYEERIDAVFAALIYSEGGDSFEISLGDGTFPLDVPAEEFVGLMEEGGEKKGVVSWIEDTSIDDWERVYGVFPVTREEEVSIREWVEGVLKRKEGTKRRAERIAELFRENGLDDQSIQEKRDALLVEKEMICQFCGHWRCGSGSSRGKCRCKKARKGVNS